MGSIGNFYYRTYARVALLPYIGGTVLHLVRLAGGDPAIEIPWEVDYFIVFVGGYAGTGFAVFMRRIPFTQLVARILHGLVAIHLLASVVLHARAILIGNHDLFAAFSYNYSYFAVAYFAVLGIYCFMLQKRISNQARS